MIKSNLKTIIITSIVTILPIAAGLILWDKLPAQMPLHWNAAGEADGFYGKNFAVIFFPLILLALHWLCVLATLADPKKANHSKTILRLVFWIIPVLSLLLGVIIYSTALGIELPIEMIVPAAVGLLLSVIGLFLPKCRQNYSIGIKLPWTLNSEENWRKTHRLAGPLWVIGGIAVAVFCILGYIWGMLIIIPIMAFTPAVYSFILYRKGI